MRLFGKCSKISFAFISILFLSLLHDSRFFRIWIRYQWAAVVSWSNIMNFHAIAWNFYAIILLNFRILRRVRNQISSSVQFVREWKILNLQISWKAIKLIKTIAFSNNITQQLLCMHGYSILQLLTIKCWSDFCVPFVFAINDIQCGSTREILIKWANRAVFYFFHYPAYSAHKPMRRDWIDDNLQIYPMTHSILSKLYGNSMRHL